MTFRRTILAASLLTMPLVLPAAVHAQAVQGLYVGAGVGPDFHLNENVKNLTINNGILGGLSTSGHATYSTGFSGLGNVGYGFGNGFRVEAEGDYLNSPGNGFSGFTRTGALGGSGFNGGGREEQYGFMANALYDFVGLIPFVQPYVGAGVGAQWVDEQNFHAYNLSALGTAPTIVPPGGLTATSNGTKAVFAYQAIVGAAVPLPSIMPGLALTAEYRFMGTAGNRSDPAFYSVTTGAGVTTSANGKVSLGPAYNNMVLVGFRYNFGQAPPPPPAPVATPAPAVEPARSYLVFFDWDKATLTDRARSIIKEAADNSTHVQYTRIEVNGYTDTSGTPQYNQRLSVRRAQAVAGELVHDGVPQSAITAQGFGDTHLLVATGPGVREPQNRRVEIIIH